MPVVVEELVEVDLPPLELVVPVLRVVLVPTDVLRVSSFFSWSLMMLEGFVFVRGCDSGHAH